MSFWKDAYSWISGKSLGSTLVKTALVGYSMKLLNDSINESSTGKNETVDPGVRLQLAPDTETKIPVLYGSAYFGGNITDAVLSADYKTMKYCLTLCETTGTKLSGGATTYLFEDVYLNNNRVIFKADGITVDYTVDSAGNQDISMRDLVKIYMYAGGAKQPVGYSGTTPAATSIMTGWTNSTHPMTGLAYAIVEVTYNRAKNVVGLPDCKFHLTSNMTLPGDVLYDYMTSTRYGAGISSADIDNSLVALNTYASAGFGYKTSTGATTSSVISINGLVDTQTVVIDNMEEIVKAASSWLTFDVLQGKWSVIINQAAASVATFTDSNIIGEISISGTSLTQLDNAADVKFQNNEILDKPDFVKVSIPSGSLLPNEPLSTLQLSLPFTNKQAVALKLGLQLLKQARIDKIITFTADFSYINLRAGDVIAVTSPVFAFTNKLFRIVTCEEVEGDLGDIQVSITALEYDATVYDYDIQEFTVITNDGILTIGSIGKPAVPQVTKLEQDSRPRIFIESITPSGVVEGMEYWISNDVSVDESTRVYRLIATRVPDSQGLYTEGTAVSVEYDALNSSDFVIKTRGFNSQVFGPYSDPSGFIEFRPTQTTDAISDNTKAIGGLLGALTVLDLLKSVDELLGGQVGKSLITGVLDTLFPGRNSNTTDVPGLLLEDADYTSEFGGAINDLNNISIDELLDVDTSTISPKSGDYLTWDGSNWVPSSGTSEGSGAIYAWGRLTLVSSEVVGVNNSFGIDTDVQYIEATRESSTFKSVKIVFATEQTGPGYVVLATKGNNTKTKETPKSFDIFDQTQKSFYINLGDASTGDVIHFAVIGQGGLGYCVIESTSRYPSDRRTYDNPLLDGPGDTHKPKDYDNTIAIDHHPYMTFNGFNVFSLVPGAGSIKLYRSNGVLDQELGAAGLQITGNRVTFPFANLEYGTDYYLLMDKGLIRGISEDGEVCYSPPITTPVEWNFHTLAKDPLPNILPLPLSNPSELPPTKSTTVIPPPGFLPVPAKCQTLEFMLYTTQTKMSGAPHRKVDIQSNIKLLYNVDIILNTTGTITIYKKNGTVWQTFNIAHSFAKNRISELFWIEEGRYLVINPTKDFEPNTEYYLLMTANCVYNTCGLIGNKAITSNQEVTWKTDPGATTEPVKKPAAKDSINQTGFQLDYDRPIQKGTGSMSIYDESDNLVARIPATDSSIRIIEG